MSLSLGCGAKPTPPTPVEGPPTVTPSPRATAATPIPRSFPRAELKQLFAEHDRRSKAHLGLVCLSRGGVAQHEGRRKFEAASLVKLPILLEYYRQQAQGAIRGDARMVFEERFRVGGSGKIKDGPAGASYRLDTLAEWMITRSDNIATDMLLEKLGMEAVQSHAREAGLRETTVQRKVFDFAAIDGGRDNLTTPADMAALLDGWRLGKWPGSPEALRVLEKQERRDVMVALLPAGLRVAHKTGQLNGVLHDVGIVYPDEEPTGYVLVLMSQGGDPEAVRQQLAQLSREVYSLFTRPIRPPGPGQKTPTASQSPCRDT